MRYELAVIVQDGIKRMFTDGENIFYYLTVMNEQYAMPDDARPPRNARRESLRGLYLLRTSDEAARAESGETISADAMTDGAGEGSGEDAPSSDSKKNKKAAVEVAPAKLKRPSCARSCWAAARF